MLEIGAANGRNVTIDFFRGLALLIIFVNHVPGNELLLFTPSRFGLSDAAEIFVFLSGYVAAVAYGGTFVRGGFVLGTVRVFHRCWQIYAAHLALFGLLALVCVLGNALLDTRDYIDHLNIRYFFDHTEEALLNLIALRYVPNYFDILPMYLVVMSGIPAIWALSRIRPGVALGVSFGIYLAMWWADLALPADPHSSRPWFFNPFGWQFLFFIGFAFGAGWVRPPGYRVGLIVLCLAFIALALPFGPEPNLRPGADLQRLYTAVTPWLEKTRFGPLRLLHFLALAYLVRIALMSRSHWMRSALVQRVAQLGQLSLPMFLFCMVVSYLGGMSFDVIGHGFGSITTINLAGMGFLLAVASGMAWFKSSPWKQQARCHDESPSAAGNDAWRMAAGSRLGVNALAGAALLAVAVVLPLSLPRAKPVGKVSGPVNAAVFENFLSPSFLEFPGLSSEPADYSFDLGASTSNP